MANQKEVMYASSELTESGSHQFSSTAQRAVDCQTPKFKGLLQKAECTAVGHASQNLTVLHLGNKPVCNCILPKE